MRRLSGSQGRALTHLSGRGAGEEPGNWSQPRQGSGTGYLATCKRRGQRCGRTGGGRLGPSGASRAGTPAARRRTRTRPRWRSCVSFRRSICAGEGSPCSCRLACTSIRRTYGFSCRPRRSSRAAQGAWHRRPLLRGHEPAAPATARGRVDRCHRHHAPQRPLGPSGQRRIARARTGRRRRTAAPPASTPAPASRPPWRAGWPGRWQPGRRRSREQAERRPPPGQPPLSCSGRSGRQTADPAFQSAQFRFQPLRPLSGATVLSPVFWTTTTSPTIELV
jgi:hypothetical protein